ncbi:MAG TPA: DNA methyltransferase [Candidatus Sulfotelmatobacter sp.]
MLYQIDAYSDDGIITSGFDPVLSEIVYRWFSPPGGLILDPFSGGSTRGIVASKCGRDYVGIDLRPEQIQANREQAERICDEPMPKWLVGDSSRLADIVGSIEADFIFTSPPYAGLERYSDDGRDLSTMDYETFIVAYREIIANVLSLLKPNRFACFIVGDKRAKDGNYIGLPWRTVEAFETFGSRLYNEAVLITPPGSVPIRMRKQFEMSRKFGKTHQNVLVFVKGDPREAALAIGAPEFHLPSMEDDLFSTA